MTEETLSRLDSSATTYNVTGSGESKKTSSQERFEQQFLSNTPFGQVPDTILQRLDAAIQMLIQISVHLNRIADSMKPREEREADAAMDSAPALKSKKKVLYAGKNRQIKNAL